MRGYEIPAKGYTWKTTPALNKQIWEEYRETSLKDARNMLNKSFAETQKIIEKHSDAELFEKKNTNGPEQLLWVLTWYQQLPVTMNGH